MEMEILKALLSLLVVAITLGLTWKIGLRISADWAARQKQRELELTAVNRFYSNYGEFRAVLQLWNQHLDESAGANEIALRREKLLERACAAEGTLEAALLKLASERVLDSPTCEKLGNLRQGFQVLRERIRDRKPISYDSAKHHLYLEFKGLASYFGTLLASPEPARHGTPPHPTPEEAFKAFCKITSNEYESHWKDA